jgi:hypothetical protein
VGDPKARPATRPPELTYPSCETTLWQIGVWRCDYWRPAGTWCGSSLRLLREGRLVRTVEFGLRAWEQSSAWRIAVRDKPEHDPRCLL